MKRTVTLLIAAVMAASSAYAQSSFDSRYEEAKEFYVSGNYASALETLNHALTVENLTKDQKEKVNKLINQCKHEIDAAKKLVISRKDFGDINFLGEKVSTYVAVPSKKKWMIGARPDWISFEAESDRIVFTIHENTTHSVRTGDVEITLDKTSTAYVHFVQQARPETEKMVTISAVPETVSVSIDKGDVEETPLNVVMRSGNHTIRATHNMYEPLDTTIFIKDDLNKEQLYMDLKLKRKFATVNVSISDEDGKDILNSPIFYIDGKKIDLRPNTLGDYNEIKKIEFNTLYQDGTIPIQAGNHVFKASAQGYYDQEIVRKNMMENTDYHLEFNLSPKAGFINISDTFDAEGADVFIDGKQVAGKKVPCDSVKVITGSHVLTFRKEGMVSTEESYPVEVKEGMVYSIDLSMIGCDTYTFAGNLPIGAAVVIDSTEVGKVPLTTALVKGRHSLHIQKPGYMSIDDLLTVEGSNRQIAYDKVMEATMPFSVMADEDNLSITISQDGRTIVSNALTPADLEIPLSDKKYDITLMRGNRHRQRTAYRGTFMFDSEADNSISIQSWSDQFFHILDGQYYLSNNTWNIFGRDYRECADISFLNMKLFNGMSTSLAKAKLFLSNDESSMVYEGGTVESKKLLPAFSCIIINEELRIGGAIFQYMDANLLATYAWYPDMTSFLPLTHASGHDVFAGLEISSRFPVLTVSFKAGYETMLNGKANIHVTKPGQSSQNTADEFITTPLDFGQVVFGINISISDSRSKGNNILRIF